MADPRDYLARSRDGAPRRFVRGHDMSRLIYFAVAPIVSDMLSAETGNAQCVAIGRQAAKTIGLVEGHSEIVAMTVAIRDGMRTDG